MKNKLISIIWITLILITVRRISFAQSPFSSKLIGVGVVVSDLEKSLDFYTNVIGMVKTGDFSLDSNFAKGSGLSNGFLFQ